MTSPTIRVITGPTAVGKTAHTIALAKELNTEIVSFDSRQFYRELSIGTAKPSVEEMQGVPHHFIGSHSISSHISAGQFEKLALPKVYEVIDRTGTCILTGGSGLFLDAVLYGLDEFPDVSPAIRKSLRETFQKEGLAPLQEKLKASDPAYFNQVDIENHSRIIRALEVMESSGKTYSSFLNQKKEARGFTPRIEVLSRERSELYNRINSRVEQMMEMGLLNEVESVRGYQQHSALQTVGYKELFAYLDGMLSLEEAIEEIKKNSRRYAKRQITWFKRYENAEWLNLTN